MAWIYHNATLWVISLSSDGENWITIADKNLGATEVYEDGDTLSEANSGKYYQWWNNYGFPFTWSVTTSSTQVDASTYWPWNYYSSSTFITYDWRWDTTDNWNLWWGVTWTNEAMQWPCNTGYHVPSKDEWAALCWILTTTFRLASTSDTMKTYLKMPMSGFRSYSSAGVSYQGTYGLYWSANAYNTNNAYLLSFNSSTLNPQDWYPRAFGLSLRCFKNTPVVPYANEWWTKLYWDELPEPPEPQLPKLKRIIKHNNYYFFWEKPIHASGITLNKSSITLATAWQTEQLTATVTPNDAVNKKVIWSSSDTSVATVSSTGLVTCVTPGNATITATAADGWASASCSVDNSMYIDFLLIAWWGWWWQSCSNSWWWGWWAWWYIECSNYKLSSGTYSITIWEWWIWEYHYWSSAAQNGWDSCFWNIKACWWWAWWWDWSVYPPGWCWCVWWSWWWAASTNLSFSTWASWISWQWYSWGWNRTYYASWGWGWAWWAWWNWCIDWSNNKYWWNWGVWKCSSISWQCCWYSWWWGWYWANCWCWWCWWWWNKSSSATYYWWGWGWGYYAYNNHYDWYQWVFILRYPTACWYDITWWTCYTCGDYTIHCFTSNGTLTVN